MKRIKFPILIASLALFFLGCGSAAPIISTPMGNISLIPVKNAPLSEKQLKSWSASDLVKDTIPGMSVDKAYSEIIKGRKGKPVIVGVIDSGVDIEHEDLKDVIWTNEKEIAGNGRDDDGNGYIDDIHGWNFLGDMVGENLEYVRYIKKLGPKFEGKSESSISATDRPDYTIYKKAKAEYDAELIKANSGRAQYEQIIAQVRPAHEAISKKLGKENYTKEDLQAIQNPTDMEKREISILAQMLNYGDFLPEVLTNIQDGIDHFKNQLAYNLNMDKDFRSVLGDNPEDLNDKFYGNNDVDGPDPKKTDVMHGTHVAGIIAGVRNNGIGVNGVANNVKIMVVRTVPDGDENDKDVALAIRYAVDNGAKVLNTSFGKYYSPHPDWVRDALKYAASKDVLIVNAAGNEAENLDQIQVYPNDQTPDNPVEVSDTFLTVGALNYVYDSSLVATFSNYGKSNVDVFAPGVKIWSTTPINSYKYLQGTSMASPAVAGCAAMIRSFYPNLSAKQVKDILMQSGLSSNMEVVLGGDPSHTAKFSEISKSGKMVNLYNALIMADKLSNK